MNLAPLSEGHFFGGFMATSLSICNSALIKLGAESISSLSDNNKRAKLCNAQYEVLKNKVLRAHPWNFAIKRAKLTVNAQEPSWGFYSSFDLPGDCLRVLETQGRIDFAIEGNLLSIKEGFTEMATEEIEAGSTSTTINVTNSIAQVGDVVLINSERRVVSGVTANDVSLSVALSGAPSATDAMVIYRPADVYIKYIADVDESEFTDDFAEALAHYIAYELAFSLNQSKELRNENYQLYQEIVRETRSYDAQEGTPEDYIVDTFTGARL